MKYLVGETAEGSAVFAVTGENAVNLTALDPNVGSDLMGVIEAGGLSDSVAAQIVHAL